ncbi:putative Heat shock protein 70 family [Medicago truncatula]|uniref:Putative Heat shock protein 70 family n=1 Tax=Medicago truncatula TaxID=3880 RepID=A0A396IH85_MEDTR|nr:putative Heat shock protein 70 family [Medicago truncatula]
MKHSIGRVDTDPEVKNFPFMLQILCNDIRPFFGALMMDKVWRYTTAKQFLAIYIGQLKLLAETQLKRRIRNVVFTVPVSFS